MTTATFPLTLANRDQLPAHLEVTRFFDDEDAFATKLAQWAVVEEGLGAAHIEHGIREMSRFFTGSFFPVPTANVISCALVAAYAIAFSEDEEDGSIGPAVVMPHGDTKTPHEVAAGLRLWNVIDWMRELRFDEDAA